MPLEQFLPGFRLVDGTQLNTIVDTVNDITGGTGPIDATTVTAETVVVSAGVSAATVAATTSLTLGAGTALTKAVVYGPTITPGVVTANLSNEQAFTVTGLTTADKVIINPVATGNGTMVGAARVSGANTLAVSFTNPTAGDLTPAAGVWAILALRS